MHLNFYAGIAILGMLTLMFGAIGKSSTALIFGAVMVAVGAYHVFTTPSGWDTVVRSIFTFST